jgi:hypothetical protein
MTEPLDDTRRRMSAIMFDKAFDLYCNPDANVHDLVLVIPWKECIQHIKRVREISVTYS